MVIRMDTSTIARLAEAEGRQGVNRWIGEHAELFRDDNHLAESLYERLKEESPGAALLFALVLQKRDLLPPGPALDLQNARKSNIHLWVSGVCHVMMPAVLEKVHGALESGDILFGWHCFYCGACSPGNVAFTSFHDFEESLAGARPGDYFQLVSLRQLTARGGILEPTLAAARRYLAAAPRGEVWVLRTGLRPPEVEVMWEGNSDEPDVESWLAPSEGLYLARVREDLEFDDEYFLDAKKPDPHGAVPLGGAY